MLSTALTLDPSVPFRERLLDPTVMKAYLGLSDHLSHDDPELVRVKYRFGQSLRVVYRIRTASETSAVVSLRTFPREHRAWRATDATPIPELGAVKWSFPADRRLRGIEALLQPEGVFDHVFDHRWVTSRLAGYTPEKAAIVACLGAKGDALGYAKLYASVDEAARSGAVLRGAARRARNAEVLHVPRLRFIDRSRGVVVSEAAGGVSMAAASDINLRDAAARLGRALAEFHDIAPDECTPRESRDLMTRVRSGSDLVAAACPNSSRRAHALAGRLLRSVPHESARALLHGDLHLKNVLLDGDRVWLIDLDQVVVGSPARDLGSVIALFRSRAITGLGSRLDADEQSAAFVNGYASRRAVPPASEIRWHTAAALLIERAFRAVTRVRVSALGSLDEILDDAIGLLTKGVVL